MSLVSITYRDIKRVGIAVTRLFPHENICYLLGVLRILRIKIENGSHFESLSHKFISFPFKLIAVLSRQKSLTHHTLSP